MDSLGEIINRMSEERRLRRDAVKRGFLIEELKGYCEAKEYEFFPVIAEGIAGFSKPVEEYIRARTSEGLPRIPSDIRYEKMDIRDYLEVGGILGYDPSTKSLRELAYHCPSCDNDIIFENPLDLISDMAELGNINPASADHIVGWHSQHFGIGEMTKGDIDNVKTMLGNKNSWPYYHVIYLPKKDLFCWYGFESAPRLPKQQETEDWQKILGI